jgi:hypothetical protein
MLLNLAPTQSAIDAFVRQIAFFFQRFGVPPLFFPIEVCLWQAHRDTTFLQCVLNCNRYLTGYLVEQDDVVFLKSIFRKTGCYLPLKLPRLQGDVPPALTPIVLGNLLPGGTRGLGFYLSS